LNRYKITNTETGEVVEKEAEYLGHAIEETSWDPALCSCEILSGPVPAKKKRGRQKKAVAPAEDTVEKTKPEENSPLPPDVVEKARETARTDQTDAEATAQFEKKLEQEIEQIDIHSLKGDATEAEKNAYGNKQRIEAMAIEAEVMFLKMGQLLYNARIAGEWSILHYESYREYVEDLRLPMTNSYSWATRLSAIYEYLVKKMGLDEKLLAEIGVSKLTRLLPLARKGELTVEVIEAARILSDLDLRAELGQEVGSRGDEPDLIVCPHCGEVFNSKTATRSK